MKLDSLLELYSEKIAADTAELSKEAFFSNMPVVGAVAKMGWNGLKYIVKNPGKSAMTGLTVGGYAMDGVSNVGSFMGAAGKQI